MRSQPPNLEHEGKLKSQGYRFIAGIDEAGRGALAGPVVAAAVILPGGYLPWFRLVRDSKELCPKEREHLFHLIGQEAIAIGVGSVSHHMIDTVNILEATKLAIIQAIERLPQQPQFLLIDGLALSRCSIPQKKIIKGDKLCLSIACASIVAKVTRDHVMEELDKVYPGYGLARHKGYATGEHVSRLKELGHSPIHRLSFAPVRNVTASYVPSPLKGED